MTGNATPDPDTASPPDGAPSASSRPPPPPPPDRRVVPDLDAALSRLPADRARRRRWAFELLAVVSLAVVPDVVHAALRPLLSEQRVGFGSGEALLLLVRSLQVSVPVLYLMWACDEPRARFGIGRPGLLRPVVGGVAIAGVWICLWTVLATIPFVRALPHPPRFVIESRGSVAMALLVVGTLANGFAEELVMRAYLVTRLEDLTRSAGASILGAAALFAAYHGYQGTIGVLHALLFGLFFGVVFRVTRALGPLVVAHALIDLYALSR